MRQIKLGDIAVDIVLKDIKNVHLSVHPPFGRVRISAPSRMSVDTIRVFAISKLAWIKEQRKKLREQKRETPREYSNRESHYLWGKRYLLEVVEGKASGIALNGNRMVLTVRADAETSSKSQIIAQWYRDQIKMAAASLIAKWEPLLGVEVARVFVQRMKTRWGGCNSRSRTIRLNTELAKKPRDCLEYIVVHEMVHLIQPTHNAQFVALMDEFMPKWQFFREKLNRLPVRHEEWQY
jgi:predicted metal-dependent hydrolase